MGRDFFPAGINEAWVGAEKVLRCGASAKTALVAPLLRVGEAAMWRFQPLCRARWSRGLGMGEQGRGGARRVTPSWGCPVKHGPCAGGGEARKPVSGNRFRRFAKPDIRNARHLQYQFAAQHPHYFIGIFDFLMLSDE